MSSLPKPWAVNAERVAANEQKRKAVRAASKHLSIASGLLKLVERQLKGALAAEHTEAADMRAIAESVAIAVDVHRKAIEDFQRLRSEAV